MLGVANVIDKIGDGLLERCRNEAVSTSGGHDRSLMGILGKHTSTAYSEVVLCSYVSPILARAEATESTDRLSASEVKAQVGTFF